MEDQGLAVHRAIVVVDVEGFGDRHRTNAHQVAVGDGLYRVMREAFGRAGISWGDCGREDRGDGVLVLVPAEVPKGLLTESLPSALAAGLRAHYASRGWPDGTPGYAIRGYPGLLTTSSDAERLSALARDSRRHAFFSRATGSDYAALAEIRSTQRLISGQKTPDMQVLVELAIYRHAISIRNQSIPVGLPAVWERLGRFEHAEALARAVTNPDDQARTHRGGPRGRRGWRSGPRVPASS